MLGHISESTVDKKGGLHWCIALGSIMMSALKIGNTAKYHQIGTQQLVPKEAVDFLEDLFKGSHVDWWFKLLLTGQGLKTKGEVPGKEVLESVRLINANSNLDRTEESLRQFERGWGGIHPDRFAIIHQKIEELSQWG